jgi:anti-sigma B factor antagonist
MMRIRTEEIVPRIHVVAPEGDVDMSTSPLLRERLSALLKGESRGVIVDLSQVSYMDSSGIATLVEGLQLSQRNGIKFALVGLNSAVRAAFEVAHLMEVFQVADDISTCLVRMGLER